jgi:hypothetical protein
MAKSNFLDLLANKEKKPEQLVNRVMKDSGLLREVINGTSHKKADVKYGSTKILRIISEKKPDILYPHWAFFVELMDHENQILKWNAMDIIANMLRVDTEDKFNPLFEKYYELITNDVMITAGHVVDNSGKIALVRPELQDQITDYLFKVETTERDPECRNILLGKAILSFEKYFDQIKQKDEVIAFVQRQLNNSRSATKKKAEKFLSRVEKYK